MFHQLLTPVNGSLLLSFLVAAIPIAVVLAMLGVLRRPAWQAAFAGLASALLVAVTVWQTPVGLALNATAAGVAFALWPIMWIVFAALILYNVAVLSGRFDAFRRWVLTHLPNDKRIVLIVIGYGFGSLLEGVSGFGAPVAITASLLIMLFKRVAALFPNRRSDVDGVPFPLTQQHIADGLGLSLVHTNKTLRNLERRGLHRIDDGRLYLLDPTALSRIADLYGDGKAAPRPLI